MVHWPLNKKKRHGKYRKMPPKKKQKKTTLPKFNSSPLKSYLPNRKVVFQPPFFRGYVKPRGCMIFKGQQLKDDSADAYQPMP